MRMPCIIPFLELRLEGELSRERPGHLAFAPDRNIKLRLASLAEIESAEVLQHRCVAAFRSVRAAHSSFWHNSIPSNRVVRRRISFGG